MVQCSSRLLFESSRNNRGSVTWGNAQRGVAVTAQITAAQKNALVTCLISSYNYLTTREAFLVHCSWSKIKSPLKRLLG